MVGMLRGVSRFVFSSLGFLCMSFVVAAVMLSCNGPDPQQNTVFHPYDPFNQDGPGQGEFKGNYTVAPPVPFQDGVFVKVPGFGPAPQVVGGNTGARDTTTPVNFILRLLRQPDCSMTKYLTGNDTSSGGFTVYSVPNVQGYLHTAAGLTTTPNVFKNGCNDTMVGKASEQNVYAGRTKSGQVIGFQITQNNALEEAVIDLSASTTSHAGTSTFTAYPSITFAGVMVAADLNGDGNQDLIVTDAGLNGGTAGLKVLMGNGDGTFAAPVNVTPGVQAGAVTVDDMNKDGKLDLLVAGQSALLFLPGKGDGTFGASSTITTSYGGAMATGDVDGDGNKDIVLSTGMLLKGKGDGTFGAGVAISGGGGVGVPVLGDFNGDGKLDAAFSAQGGGGVSVYLGNGDGSFTAGHSYTSIYGSANISALDIDGDGNLDLVVGSGNSGALGPDQGTLGIWEVLMGNGDGTFQGAELYPAVSRNEKANQFVFGDFNGDGSVDLLTTANGTGLQVLANNGKGSFTRGVVNASTQPLAVASALMDGDKKLDAVVLDYNVNSSIYSVGVALGNGDGTFQAVKETAMADQTGGVSVATGDFNGDGHPDVVATTASTVYLYLNDGAGGLKAPAVVDAVEMNSATFGTSSAVAVGDLNGDGKMDLVVSNELVGKVKVYLGKGDGTFGAAVVYQPDTASGAKTDAVGLADVNGDGRLDMLVSTAENFTVNPLLHVYPGKGDGTFGAVVDTVLPQAAIGIAVADLNGDGKVDVLEGSCCGQAYTMLSLGNGDGTFAGTYQFANALSTVVVGTADLNGDGQADIVAGALEGGADGGLEVFLNLYGTAVSPVTPVGTTTALTAGPNPATAGATVTLTAKVAATSGTGVPTGTVTFYDGTSMVGTGMLSAGTAAFTTAGLGVGSHGLTAMYGGDMGDAASVSAGVVEVVNAASPTLAATATVLTASATTAVAGTQVTLTAKVVQASGTGVPTGTVTFYDGTSMVGTGMLTAGMATFATAGLGVGTHTLTASYGGDAGNATSVSAGVGVTITAVSGTQGFSLALNPASGTVGQLGMVSTTLTVTPAGGFNQAVTFACGGLPSHSICSFSPSVATPVGGAVTTVMTIETGLATASAAGPRGMWEWPVMAGVLGLGLVGVRRRWRGTVWVMVLGVAGLGMMGCGKGAPVTLSPTGTNAVTVTATAGTVSQTVTYALTVQ